MCSGAESGERCPRSYVLGQRLESTVLALAPLLPSAHSLFPSPLPLTALLLSLSFQALATDSVPGSWRNLAYPSLRPLGSWLQNLLQRVQQLVDWTADLSVPKVRACSQQQLLSTQAAQLPPGKQGVHLDTPSQKPAWCLLPDVSSFLLNTILVASLAINLTIMMLHIMLATLPVTDACRKGTLPYKETAPLPASHSSCWPPGTQVVWLSGLFNPQSFLTAVMQTTARRNDWPLDKTVVVTEVTKKQPDQIDAPSRDGAFIHGLALEGCRWDDKVRRPAHDSRAAAPAGGEELPR